MSRLLAAGDSITVGDDDPDVRVTSRSWARWVADALGLQPRVIARDGWTAPDLAAALAPGRAAGVAVAALHIGVNDVRSPAWDPARFEPAYAGIVDALAGAERLVVCTVPLDLGRPRAGAKVNEVNRIIRAQADRAGALVAPLDDLAGPTFLGPDAVHPTDAGQREIARRVLAVL